MLNLKNTHYFSPIDNVEIKSNLTVGGGPAIDQSSLYLIRNSELCM